MLIKNYTLGLAGEIHITENVTDVVVHTNQYLGKNSGPTPGDTAGGPRVPNSWIYQDDVKDDQPVRFIDYTKDGIRNRLYVTNFAYICSDDGKTIERVKVIYPPGDMPMSSN